ncbi:MAG TPA: hypothetical protein VFU80_03920 [Sphingomicrobium sp.]|nr:hypothetical protein [Sphingomicrobium sp.]
MLLVLAAAISQQTLPPSISAVEQARATVRIVCGARVTADRLPEEALVRDTKVLGPDGSRKPARLIEFP